MDDMDDIAGFGRVPGSQAIHAHAQSICCVVEPSSYLGICGHWLGESHHVDNAQAPQVDVEGLSSRCSGYAAVPAADDALCADCAFAPVNAPRGRDGGCFVSQSAAMKHSRDEQVGFGLSLQSYDCAIANGRENAPGRGRQA